MKWVKKGAFIRLCDDTLAAKLLREGYEEFFPVTEEPKVAQAQAVVPPVPPVPVPEPKAKKD